MSPSTLARCRSAIRAGIRPSSAHIAREPTLFVGDMSALSTGLCKRANKPKDDPPYP